MYTIDPFEGTLTPIIAALRFGMGKPGCSAAARRWRFHKGRPFVAVRLANDFGNGCHAQTL